MTTQGSGDGFDGNSGAEIGKSERTLSTLTVPMRELLVRVEDPDKQPIAGAVVSSFGKMPPIRAQTGSDGLCMLFVPEGLTSYALRVERGSSHLQARWNVSPQLTVTLPWAGVLNGRVVDFETGEGIADVRVQRSHGSCKECEPDVVYTDVEGGFVMAGVPREQTVPFSFLVGDYAWQFDRRKFPGRGEPVDCTFRLQRGAEFVGRFVDSQTRRPVPGAKITHEGFEFGQSGPDGTFSIRLLTDSDNKALASVQAEGYCRHGYTLPNDSGSSDYLLVQATTLTGTVVSTTGEPIAGARVRSHRTGYKASPSHPRGCRIEDAVYFVEATSDEHGEFVLSGLVPDANYRVRCSHADYESLREHRFGFEASTAPGAPSVTLSLQRKLFPNGKGVIVGSYRLNGELSDGRVQWRLGSQQKTSSIDQNGAFRLEDVPAGIVRITAMGEEFQGAQGDVAKALHCRREVTVVDGQEVRIDLDHPVEMVPITGTIKRTDGTPVADQWLSARSGDMRGFRTRSGKDGSYSLTVPAVLDTVSVGAGDCVPSTHDVKPGAPGVNFVAVEKSKLRFRVTSESGPVTWPQVHVQRTGDKWPHRLWQDAPGPDGFYETRLVKGAYKVWIGASGHAVDRREVTVGDSASIDVRLASGVAVTLRLASDAFTPPPNTRIQIVNEFDASVPALEHLLQIKREVLLSHDGDVISHVEPGKHRLVCSDPSFELVPATVSVGAYGVTCEVRMRRKKVGK